MSADPQIVLAAAIGRAERLLSSGRLVGDTQDFRLWQLSVRTWVRDTLDGLSESVDSASLHTFERAVAKEPSEGSLAADLAAQVEDVTGAMEVLTGIRERVARRAAEGGAGKPAPRGFSEPLSGDG